MLHLFFKVNIGSFNEIHHFIFVSYLVDYYTFLLTNFSANIWQQTVFVPLINQVIVVDENYCSYCS